MNDKYLSLTYQDSVNFPSNKEYESIDLILSSILNVELDRYPNLQRIRISKCDKLVKVHLSNMPRLQVVDLLDNRNLESVIFHECPSITTIEGGFNSKLKVMEGIKNVEYLSVPRCYDLKVEKLEKIVYLDILDNKYSDVKDIILNAPNLECLCCTSSVTLNLSEITKNHSLKILQVKSTNIICDSIDPDSQLKIIIFDQTEDYKKCVNENGKDLLSHFYVADNTHSNQAIEKVLNIDEFIPKYQSYQKLLYGPWGVPEIDKKPPVKVTKAVIQPPSGINQEKAADAIVGSIMTSAVMDMVGVGVEFINGVVAKPLLLGHLNITWTHPRSNFHNRIFIRGTPTDDTSQCILIMRTIVDLNSNSNNKESENSSFNVDNVTIDPRKFASEMLNWVDYGHREHKQNKGLGIGSTTSFVVFPSKISTRSNLLCKRCLD